MSEEAQFLLMYVRNIRAMQNIPELAPTLARCEERARFWANNIIAGLF